MKKIIFLIITVLFISSCAVEPTDVDELQVKRNTDFFKSISVYLDDNSLETATLSLKVQPKSEAQLMDIAKIELIREDVVWSFPEDGKLITNYFDTDSNEIELWGLLEPVDQNYFISGNFRINLTLKDNTLRYYDFSLTERDISNKIYTRSSTDSIDNSYRIMPTGESITVTKVSSNMIYVLEKTDSTMDFCYILLSRGNQEPVKVYEIDLEYDSETFNGSLDISYDTFTEYSLLFGEEISSDDILTVYYRLNQYWQTF